MLPNTIPARRVTRSAPCSNPETAWGIFRVGGPIGDNLRIGVAVYSYQDAFGFGITADYRSVPETDLEILTGGISRGLAELLARSKRAGHKS